MKFEVIPNEQTPRVPEVDDLNTYVKANINTLREFLEYCESRTDAAGLACNQVSADDQRLMLRAFAHKDPEDLVWKLVIDPVIEEYIGMKELKCEGCLTWRYKTVVAERSRAIRVRYYDGAGNLHTGEFRKGFDAQVWQHEINHLNGVEERIEDFEYGYTHSRPKEPQRNDKCPCGSGKKYKVCCLLYL
jgi:peptide deformylase